MVLFEVRAQEPPIRGEVYRAYVVAVDEKHAERLARTVYWNSSKIGVEVKPVDMSAERIIGADEWYK